MIIASKSDFLRVEPLSVEPYPVGSFKRSSFLLQTLVVAAFFLREPMTLKGKRDTYPISYSRMPIFSKCFALHDHHHRKMLIGSIGLVASTAMYGSPLVAVVSLHVIA
ncbi:hypothetical protein J5N97_028119 [Dioscorea zingiberensis]|uniref:Uncharacterized protein n=1 Tax=Dioscorea zingiberensis TaxID=325984 RepID=A0A9D5BYZ1_9LILI|nr:hypothetical protein J5N97_028119 [Dioscorea zingiberensis]